MNAEQRRTLVNMLAHLDQMSVDVEEIHGGCVGTDRESVADEMRERLWEMQAAIQAVLKMTE